jgi:hypothetical protein
MPKKIVVTVNVNKREPQNLSPGDSVEFQANGDCDLYFTNSDVFGTGSVQLTNGKNTVVVQADGTTSWTALSGSKRKASAGAGNPNEIVVP